MGKWFERKLKRISGEQSIFIRRVINTLDRQTVRKQYGKNSKDLKGEGLSFNTLFLRMGQDLQQEPVTRPAGFQQRAGGGDKEQDVPLLGGFPSMRMSASGLLTDNECPSGCQSVQVRGREQPRDSRITFLQWPPSDLIWEWRSRDSFEGSIRLYLENKNKSENQTPEQERDEKTTWKCWFLDDRQKQCLK